MSEQKKPESENPPHNLRVGPDPGAERARLYAWHKARGSLGMFYDLYPEMRPAEPEPGPARAGGRGGR